MIKFEFEEDTTENTLLTLDEVRSNEFFIDKENFLCQKSSSHPYVYFSIADNFGNPASYVMVNSSPFGENKIVKKILGLPKIKFS